MYSVYKLYKNKELIYVGRSIEVEKRLERHKRDKVFDEVEIFNTNDKLLMEKLENYLIYKYLPKLNITCSFNFRDEISYLESLETQFEKLNLISNKNKFVVEEYLKKILPEYFIHSECILDYMMSEEQCGLGINVKHFQYAQNINFIVYHVQNKLLICVKVLNNDVLEERTLVKTIANLSKGSYIFLVFPDSDQESWLDFPLKDYLTYLHCFDKNSCNIFKDWLDKDQPTEIKILKNTLETSLKTNKDLAKLQQEKRKINKSFKYKKKRFYYEISYKDQTIRYHPVLHTFHFKKKSISEDFKQKIFQCEDTRHAINVFYKIVEKHIAFAKEV